jgi:NAD(P)H-hydrate epimerase
MIGADRRAQALGVPAERLMEHAGTAVAAAARALAADTERAASRPILVLCGPGNNGGDGFVAARRLALTGAEVIVVLVGADARPRSPVAGRNWDRLERDRRVTRLHAASPQEVGILAKGIERAAVVIDALLGSGVQGALREPIRTAVEVVNRARGAGVPILAVDTPTAVDLTSGEPSEPVVHADLTVTFHRPKTGLRRRVGAALAGRVLVAPIGIPHEADPV